MVASGCRSVCFLGRTASCSNCVVVRTFCHLRSSFLGQFTSLGFLFAAQNMQMLGTDIKETRWVELEGVCGTGGQDPALHLGYISSGQPTVTLGHLPVTSNPAPVLNTPTQQESRTGPSSCHGGEVLAAEHGGKRWAGTRKGQHLAGLPSPARVERWRHLP